MSVIEVRGLRVELTNGNDVVDGVSFTVEAGEIVGLVGESGSGKTTVGTSLLGYVRGGARIVAGEVLIGGADVAALTGAALAKIRGADVAYVPQDPAAGLNPARKVGNQLAEVVEVHQPSLTATEVKALMLQTLAEVKLPANDDTLGRYPHQMSGGQQQRIMLAMAFINRPKAIVLDEPTTGLDVTTQAHVLETVRQLCKAHQVAAVYVSHDLALVRGLADRVLVAYAGRVVEQAPCTTLFDRPAHPYSRGLLAAIPDIAERRSLVAISGSAPPPGSRPDGCAFAPRCSFAIDACRESEPVEAPVEQGHSARCFRVGDVLSAPPLAEARDREACAEAGAAPILAIRGLDAFYGTTQVLDTIDLDVPRGRCLALVGESGSGKTTLSRCLIGLHTGWTGNVHYDGRPLATSARARTADDRRRLQYIFQNPYRALNPRHSVGDSIAAPLAHFFGVKGAEADGRVAAALERVSLLPRMADRLPRELSGGERQRVAIARALVCEPETLICDEITSALDVSVQASILALLEELRREQELTMLFVTHNLAVVRAIATEVAVLNGGRIVEAGAVDRVLDAPQDAYTQALIADSPSLLAVAG